MDDIIVFLTAAALLGACFLAQCVKCVFMYWRIKRQRQAVASMEADRAHFDACLALYSGFRRIRHDFANYVQAAQLVTDELPVTDGETWMQLQQERAQQKQAVRKLIAGWVEQKASVFPGSLKDYIM